MWSLRPPFMSACDPLIQAERRCNARCLNRSRWDCSLAAGRWCPVARCRKYPQLATALSNRGLPGQPFRKERLKAQGKDGGAVEFSDALATTPGNNGQRLAANADHSEADEL